MASGPRLSPPALMPIRTFTVASSAPSSAPTARAMPASSTSRWVTKRTVSGAMACGQDAVTLQVGQQLVRLGVGERHDVRPHRGGVEPAPGPALRHRIGQPGGPRVVLGQPLDHLAQRHQARCGQHTGLAHATAQPLARQPPLGDHVRLTRQQRPHRGAQSLGQAAHDRRRRRGPRRRRHARRRLGVEEPGPVHVDGDRSRPPRRAPRRPRRRPGRTRGRHVRVLDADQRDRRLVVRRRPARPADVAGARACRRRRRAR